MGADIRLVDPETRAPVVVGRFSYGSNVPVGGTDRAELSVTYNYNAVYRLLWQDGQGGYTFTGLVEFFDGKRAGDLLPLFEHAVLMLGVRRHTNYWEASLGNAGYFMDIMRRWAERYPDAIFEASG